MNSRKCAKARQLLLIVWLFVAFNLTLSYREVLIANLVNVEYENTIDNFEDVIDSGKIIGLPGNTLTPHLMLNDPRESAKALLDKIVYFNFSIPHDAWVKDGWDKSSII